MISRLPFPARALGAQMDTSTHHGPGPDCCLAWQLPRGNHAGVINHHYHHHNHRHHHHHHIGCSRLPYLHHTHLTIFHLALHLCLSLDPLAASNHPLTSFLGPYQPPCLASTSPTTTETSPYTPKVCHYPRPPAPEQPLSAASTMAALSLQQIPEQLAVP